MHTDEAEYEQLFAERRVESALSKKPPAAADNVFNRGDLVCVHREGFKSCTRPRQVAGVDGKCVFVHLGEQFGPKAFNITQLKPAVLRQSQRTEDPIGSVPTLWPTHFTEILIAADDRKAHFGDAKRAEVLSLIDKGAFRIVVQEEAGDKPNIAPSKFVLAINKQDGEEILKARFVLGRHRDRDKKKLVHSSAILKQSSVRLLSATAVTMGFEVVSPDVTRAYLPSASGLKRKIFVKPNCIDLKTDELLQIMKTLYGLAESGDYCAQTFIRHHLTDLRMTQATGDFSLFFKRARGALIEMLGCYVYDVA
jgi:Reverse transcriptase (RNA-dependent DNA polymerase)